MEDKTAAAELTRIAGQLLDIKGLVADLVATSEMLWERIRTQGETICSQRETIEVQKRLLNATSARNADLQRKIDAPSAENIFRPLRRDPADCDQDTIRQVLAEIQDRYGKWWPDVPDLLMVVDFRKQKAGEQYVDLNGAIATWAGPDFSSDGPVLIIQSRIVGSPTK